jgi:DNA polymerase III delta subunit
MPQIELYDQAIIHEMDQWEDVFMTENEPNNTEKRKKPITPKTDLLMARNPKNPYPIFKLLQSATAFTAESVLDAIEDLGRVDLQLKSSRLSPRLILEKVILSICR